MVQSRNLRRAVLSRKVLIGLGAAVLVAMVVAGVGIWSVDTSIGTFTFEEATGSFVGFRVEEELSGIGSTTAVGRTGAVLGQLEIIGTELVGTTVTADLSEINTNMTLAVTAKRSRPSTPPSSLLRRSC